MRLTTGACAKLWASANDPETRPKEWEGRYACIGCQVGAGYNGAKVTVIAAVAEELRDTCPRCKRAGLRLINRDLCVSCYNRDREARIQRDRKGYRPMICDVLRTRELVVSMAGANRIVLQRTTSYDEIILRMVKSATAAVSFGRPWHGQSDIMLNLPLRLRPRHRAGRRRRLLSYEQCHLNPAWPIEPPRYTAA